MFAGRPNVGVQRLNSFQLAAISVRGSSYRGNGAINGAQLRMQDEIAGLGGAGLSNNAGSLTAGLNGGGDRVTSLLERIANALENGGGGASARPGEAAGYVAAALGRKDVGQQGAYRSRN